MSHLGLRRPLAVSLAGLLAVVAMTIGCLVARPAAAASPSAADQVGTLALANVGKGAGTCSTVNRGDGDAPAAGAAAALKDPASTKARVMDASLNAGRMTTSRKRSAPHANAGLAYWFPLRQAER
jgi:hypothetical protein